MKYQRPEEHAYSTFKDSYGELVCSLLGGTDINYVGHMECIHRSRDGEIKDSEHRDTSEMGIWK